MSGRAKHAQRIHRSYHTNMAMAHAAARSLGFKAAVKAQRKERGAAIANLVMAAKNLMTHKTTEK
jgi:hypothetical protein